VDAEIVRRDVSRCFGSEAFFSVSRCYLKRTSGLCRRSSFADRGTAMHSTPSHPPVSSN
jgi:hypothetical protein